MNQNIFFCIFLFLALTLIIFLIILINTVCDTVLNYHASKKLFLSAKNILCTYCKTKDYQQCIYETNIILEKNIATNKELHKYYHSPIDIFKKCLQLINEQNQQFDDITDTDAFKKNLIGLILEYGKQNPFERLEGTDSIVLKELADTLEGCPKELEGKQLINSLAIQWEKMQNIIYEKDKKMARQDVISIVGLILSVVFGTMTFIQFFI